MKGTFALASTKDPQAVTVELKSGRVSLTTGVSTNADVVFNVDLAKMSDPGHKPKIKGYLRHPYLTYQVAKLFSIPPPNWTDSAKRYWSAASDTPYTPASLRITCTDDNKSLCFSEGNAEGNAEGSTEAEIIGSASKLSEVLTGNEILAQAVMRGHIRTRASMQHLAALSHTCVRILLGETSG